MMNFRSLLARPRIMFEMADAGGGGGIADAGTDTTTDTTKTDAGTADQKDTQTKDPAAQTRYQITREKELRKEMEAKYQKEIESLKNRPTFDADTDPDGTKETEYMAEQKANEIFERKLKDL